MLSELVIGEMAAARDAVARRGKNKETIVTAQRAAIPRTHERLPHVPQARVKVKLFDRPAMLFVGALFIEAFVIGQTPDFIRRTSFTAERCKMCRQSTMYRCTPAEVSRKQKFNC
jgi:hypothetical protein